ncbi:MAG: hypothetical protein LIP12_10060 [Clostridiales bacterium]|nr:hypothetical protein [Clostridiales bacterium]
MNDNESMFVSGGEVLYSCKAKSKRETDDTWDESVILLRGVCRIKDIADHLAKNEITSSVIEHELIKKSTDN